jgi:hypothetical protein
MTCTGRQFGNCPTAMQHHVWLLSVDVSPDKLEKLANEQRYLQHLDAINLGGLVEINSQQVGEK